MPSSEFFQFLVESIENPSSSLPIFSIQIDFVNAILSTPTAVTGKGLHKWRRLGIDQIMCQRSLFCFRPCEFTSSVAAVRDSGGAGVPSTAHVCCLSLCHGRQTTLCHTTTPPLCLWTKPWPHSVLYGARPTIWQIAPHKQQQCQLCLNTFEKLNFVFCFIYFCYKLFHRWNKAHLYVDY